MDTASLVYLFQLQSDPGAAIAAVREGADEGLAGAAQVAGEGSCRSEEGRRLRSQK